MAPRRKRNLLDGVLLNSATALCVLDADRRIRFVSPGFTQFSGWAAEELEGLVCDPAAAESNGTVDLLLSALSPGSDVLQGSEQMLSTVLPCKPATSRRVTLTLIPLADHEEVVTRIVVICRPCPPAAGTSASLTQKLHAELTALRLEFRRKFAAGSLIGGCSAMKRVLAQAELLADSEVNFAVVGPTGSGRNHLSRMIHSAGGRRDASFVSLDCRLLTAEQVLSALQQLQRTSREQPGVPHMGVGTLVLTAAERCPREVQQWIMEDLWTEQEGVRMVAVSEISLQDDSLTDWIRADFKERFATVEIVLPALRHRDNDISLLAQAFIEECRRTHETSAEGMSEDFERELQFYRWPGNVRELKQVVTEACQNSFEDKLTPEDLPFAFRAGVDAQVLQHAPEQPAVSLEELMRQFEMDVLRRTLDACSGNKAEAARRLGMTRPRLYRRLNTLGMGDESESD